MAYQAVRLLRGDIRPEQFMTGAGEDDGFFDALGNGPVSATDPRALGGDLVDVEPGAEAVIRLVALIGILGLMIDFGSGAAAQPVTREQAMRAAIHPVADSNGEMHAWLPRVPVTRDWPPDFADACAVRGRRSSSR
jgi:hypothetical protein